MNDFIGLWVALLVLYLASSISVGILGRRKGRSGFLFFCIGFFLSPIIGWIIVSLIPAMMVKSDSSVFAKIGNETMVKCPKCAEYIKVDAQICRYCHSEVAEAISQLVSVQNFEQRRTADASAESARIRALEEIQKQKARAALYSTKKFKVGLTLTVVLAVLTTAGTVLGSKVESDQRQLAAKEAVKSSWDLVKTKWSDQIKTCQDQIADVPKNFVNFDDEEKSMTLRFLLDYKKSSERAVAECVLLYLGGQNVEDKVISNDNDATITRANLKVDATHIDKTFGSLTFSQFGEWIEPTDLETVNKWTKQIQNCGAKSGFSITYLAFLLSADIYIEGSKNKDLVSVRKMTFDQASCVAMALANFRLPTNWQEKEITFTDGPLFVDNGSGYSDLSILKELH